MFKWLHKRKSKKNIDENKIRVLDLFAGTQSVKKALDDMDISYEYIGIDIYSPEDENLIFDLTQEKVVEKLLKVLPKDWKPDFIWASPVCNKFSLACAYKGGNLFFTLDKVNDQIHIRENWNDKKNRKYTIGNCQKNKQRYMDEALTAVNMHKNTKKIIDFFNVDFAIENPAYALSRYLYKEYERSVGNYCMYGFDYKKTTAIYSNGKIELIKCNHKEKHKRSMSGKVQQVKTYAEKSSVPPLFIKTILDQKIGGQNV